MSTHTHTAVYDCECKCVLVSGVVSPLSAQNKDIQARATFYPLSGKTGAVGMCYRSLYIGTGESQSNRSV